MDTAEPYWFRNGYNPNAVASVLLGGVPTIVLVLVGCGLGFVAFTLLERGEPADPAPGPRPGGRHDRGGSVSLGVAVRRRVAVVNPNTTESTTTRIAAAARRVVDASTEVVAIRNTHGPAPIESHDDEAMAVPGLLAEVASAEADGVDGVDGFVIACFGDPGLDATASSPRAWWSASRRRASTSPRCWFSR